MIFVYYYTCFSSISSHDASHTAPSRLYPLAAVSMADFRPQSSSHIPVLEDPIKDTLPEADNTAAAEAHQLDLADKFSQISEDLNLGDEESVRYRLEFKSFMHREQFRQHINDVPTLDQPFQCTECRKTFASAHDLWGHQTSVGSATFACNYRSCTEVFLKLTDFAVHYAAHGGERLHIPSSLAGKKGLHITCPVCTTVVPGLYKLARHKMKHDAELKYKCPACPKQFVKANTLRSHITNVHKGKQKVQKECTLCDAVSTSKTNIC